MAEGISDMKKELLFLIMALCAVCMVSCQQTSKGEMSYPQAEWSEACEILMHTPGPELFNGVIHPSAVHHAWRGENLTA